MTLTELRFLYSSVNHRTVVSLVYILPHYCFLTLLLFLFLRVNEFYYFARHLVFKIALFMQLLSNLD